MCTTVRDIVCYFSTAASEDPVEEQITLFFKGTDYWR